MGIAGMTQVEDSKIFAMRANELVSVHLWSNLSEDLRD